MATLTFHERLSKDMQEYLPSLEASAKDWTIVRTVHEDVTRRVVSRLDNASPALVEKAKNEMMAHSQAALVAFIKNTMKTFEFPAHYKSLVYERSVQDLFAWLKLTFLAAFPGASVKMQQEYASTRVLQAWHFAAHQLSGEKTFEVSPGLGVNLVNTVLDGIGTEDLHLPYTSIFLVVPKSVGLQIFNNTTGYHQVEGMYIVEDSTPESSTRRWHILVLGTSKDPLNPYDDAIFHFNVDLPTNVKLEEALRVSEGMTRSACERNMSPEAMEFYLANWRALFSFAMNAVVYATWPDAEKEYLILNKEARQLTDRIQKLPKNSKKREELRGRLKNLDPQHRIYLGRSITLTTAEEELEARIAREGHALRVRLYVMGHWKNQPYGPNSSLRKRIWIRAYERGPKDAPVVNHDHVLV